MRTLRAPGREGSGKVPPAPGFSVLGSPAFGGVAIAGGSVFAETETQGDSGWIVRYAPRGTLGQ
jgi:hypothetical protein